MTATQPETVWQAGEFGGIAGRRGVLFGRMYEDVAIEQLAFRGCERVFAIASAGCTALTLAGHHEVVACDINPVQLAYAQRRMLGGPAEPGAAERVMRLARHLMPLAGWHERELREFLALESPTPQLPFWREHLDTWRFRTGFDTLLSPKLLRLVYAQPLLDVLPARFGAVLRSRWERTFARHANRTNPYARALLLGEEAAPLSSGRRIEFVAADAAACLEAYPPSSFNAFTLSNILDGATAQYEARLWRAVRRAARQDAVVVWRSFAEPPTDLARNFALQDRSMLWGVVQVSRVDELTSSAQLP
jgi:S-adenosylmethionine:diacylglycerol 3-amino-3-carboxypropyl transferase